MKTSSILYCVITLFSPFAIRAMDTSQKKELTECKSAQERQDLPDEIKELIAQDLTKQEGTGISSDDQKIILDGLTASFPDNSALNLSGIVELGDYDSFFITKFDGNQCHPGKLRMTGNVSFNFKDNTLVPTINPLKGANSHQQASFALSHTYAHQTERQRYEQAYGRYLASQNNREEAVNKQITSHQESIKNKKIDEIITDSNKLTKDLINLEAQRDHIYQELILLEAEDNKINEKYASQKSEAEKQNAAFIPLEQYEVNAKILHKKAVVERYDDRITAIKNCLNTNNNHKNTLAKNIIKNFTEEFNGLGAPELEAQLKHFHGRLEALTQEQTKLYEKCDLQRKAYKLATYKHKICHLHALENTRNTLDQIIATKSIISQVISKGEKILENQKQLIQPIAKTYTFDADSIELIKQYDKNLIAQPAIFATPLQHALYQQNFDLLSKIGSIQNSNIPELQPKYLASASQFSFAALDQIKNNNLEKAISCTDIAYHLLQAACSKIKDATIAPILVAKGITVGAARGVLSLPVGIVNLALHPFETTEKMANFIKFAADEGPYETLLYLYENNIKGKPLDEQVAYATEIMVSFASASKVNDSVSKALKHLSAALETELQEIQPLLKSGQAVELTTQAPLLASVLEEIESTAKVVKACCKQPHAPRIVNSISYEKNIFNAGSELSIQETLQLPNAKIVKEAMKHIISGDLVKKTLKGMHHGHKFPELVISETITDPLGVYKIQWTRNGLKPKNSTCVPKDWNQIKHIDAIFEAYCNPIAPSVITEPGVISIIGQSKSGIVFQMYAELKNDAMHIRTAYPMYNHKLHIK